MNDAAISPIGDPAELDSPATRATDQCDPAELDVTRAARATLPSWTGELDSHGDPAELDAAKATPPSSRNE